MRRVDDYRRNARECRELARKMPMTIREQLEGMAREWDVLADERERFLNSQGRTEEPDPSV